LELLDVVPVRSCVDLPVERGEIVARQVLAIFGELDAEPLVRRAVQAGQEPLDHRPRLQFHRAEARDDTRVEETQVAGRGRHGYIPLRGAGTASSSRSTRVSEVTRSDSA